MGKTAAFLGLVALLAIPGSALASTADVVGATDGGLAAKALTARDFQAAAKRLREKSPDAINDAARLINLGNAYAGLGRRDAARKLYIMARQAPEQMLLLADGTEASSRAIAVKALSRLGTTYALR